MRAELICFTARGQALGEGLRAWLKEKGVRASLSPGYGPGKADLKEWTAAAFQNADALIFIGASGIAVRSVASHVVSKVSDPAVLVIDDGGRYVIPILSGHIGGANELAEKIAAKLDAIPVITTATDGNGLFAVDTWARRQGLAIVNPEKIKWVSARILSGETIRIRSQYPIAGAVPKGVELTEDKEYDVLISIRTRGKENALRLVPRVCTVGIGCRRGIPRDTIEEAYTALLRKGSVSPRAVSAACSIDLKSGEEGIISFCRAHSLPYRTFSARQLSAVPGSFTPSDFVKKTTGVDNVCERSAVCGGGENARLLLTKNAGNGVTMALAVREPTLTFESDLQEESKWEN